MIKLTEHKSAQCNINIHANKIEFISYTTVVITATHVEGNTYRLTCTGLYSNTTRRQIGWFLQEYFGNINYYDIKDIAGTDKFIDTILTK